jgi:tape measure domain-containing protein
MAETLSVSIEDKINPSILQKLKSIDTIAKSAQSAVDRLQNSLNSLSTGKLDLISKTFNLASDSISKLSATQNQLSQTQAKLTAAQNANIKSSAQAVSATSALTAAKTNAISSVKSLTNAYNPLNISLGDFIKKAVVIGAFTFGASEVLKAAEAYTNMQNKLQNVATSQLQVNQLTERLFTLANQTRSGILDLTQSFTRFDRAMANLGRSQEDTLKLTETITKALKVSGATAKETSSSLLQLSQAFNSGKLNGDEFRSIAENFPIALDAIAKSLNVPVSQLKQLSKEGKITVDVLIQAFDLLGKEIDAKFARTVPTVADAFVVLNNSVTKFIGEIDKSIGASALFAKSIIFLADNLGVVSGVFSVIGVAALVAFGPALIGAIGAASGALAAFGALVLANPIGLIAVGVTAAVLAFDFFSDQIKVSSDGLVTLRDVAGTVWDFIKDGVFSVGNLIGSVFSDVLDVAGTSFFDFVNSVAKSYELISELSKDTANFLFAAFKTAIEGVAFTFSTLPSIVEKYGFKLLNFNIGIVEKFVNSWQIGLRLVAEAAASIAPDVSNSINSALNKVTLKIPKFKESEADIVGQFKEFGRDAAQNFETDFVAKIQKNARIRASFRQIGKDLDVSSLKVRSNPFDGELVKRDGALREAGFAQPLAKEKDKKSTTSKKSAISKISGEQKFEESRAESLRKLNLELDNETKRLTILGPLREAQLKFDKIEESLASKKVRLSDGTIGRITLNKQEEKSILDKILANQKANDLQKKVDSLYAEANGPLQEYNLTLAALDKLHQMNAISQSFYNEQVEKAKNEYDLIIDPLKGYNDQLDLQLKNLKTLGKNKDVEIQLNEKIQEQAKNGIEISKDEIEQLRKKLILIKEATAIAQAEESLRANSSVAKFKNFSTNAVAANNLSASGEFSQGDRTQFAISGLQDAGLQISALQEQKDAEFEIYKQNQAKIDELRRLNFISEDSQRKISFLNFVQYQDSQLKAYTEGLDLTAGLAKSNNTTLARIGKAAAISSAIINTYLAATKTLATVPQPFTYPAVAGVIASGLANVQQIRSQPTGGFMTGGFTGNLPTGSVAGVVHGQEFVVNAAATRRIGVANLQALQDGNLSVGNSSGSAPTIIINNLPGQEAQVQTRQTDRGQEIEFTIKKVIINDIQRGGQIRDTLENFIGSTSVSSVR